MTEQITPVKQYSRLVINISNSCLLCQENVASPKNRARLFKNQVDLSDTGLLFQDSLNLQLTTDCNCEILCRQCKRKLKECTEEKENHLFAEKISNLRQQASIVLENLKKTCTPMMTQVVTKRQAFTPEDKLLKQSTQNQDGGKHESIRCRLDSVFKKEICTPTTVPQTSEKNATPSGVTTFPPFPFTPVRPKVNTTDVQTDPNDIGFSSRLGELWASFFCAK